MPLTRLELQNFRQFENAVFELHPRWNLIVGGNAAGKSTVLEAIQYLATGRSARCKAAEKLVRQGKDGFSIKGEVLQARVRHNISIAHRSGEKQVTINGISGVKIHETARLLPVSHLSPESHLDFQGESKQRRAVIDWVLFHVEQDYQGLWSRYQRVLLQRNADLKRPSGTRSTVAWNEELAMHGEAIHERRQDIILKISPLFNDICKRLLPEFQENSIQIKAGWDIEKGLGDCLRADLEKDLRHGFTHSGPHRGDLITSLAGISDISELSHGQRKMLYLAVKLTFAEFLYKACSLEISLMIDDLAAELDNERQMGVLKILSEIPGQIILTAIDPKQWEKKWSDFKSFHVKHGELVGA